MKKNIFFTLLFPIIVGCATSKAMDLEDPHLPSSPNNILSDSLDTSNKSENFIPKGNFIDYTKQNHDDEDLAEIIEFYPDRRKTHNGNIMRSQLFGDFGFLITPAQEEQGMTKIRQKQKQANEKLQQQYASDQRRARAKEAGIILPTIEE